MIKLSTFMPQYFNNNGDQGNIEVLSKQLEWRGVPHHIESSNFDDSDFLLVGDGSRAVIREFETPLADLVETLSNRLRAGKATLLVGSAHEFFCLRLPGLPSLQKISRVSDFREVSEDGFKVFGYRNSEFDVDIFMDRAFISTSLYGPVLAKNANLLDLVLKSIGVDAVLPAGQASRLSAVLKGIRPDSSPV
jgi:CobQ-like glutamine amidotransferase family enzyme